MYTLKPIDVLNSIIPISRFNKGEANKIFSEVKTFGPKIVVKNNVPECVLISPTEYQSMLEDYENLLLLTQAVKRNNENVQTISHEQLMKNLAITQDDLEGIEAEIE